VARSIHRLSSAKVANAKPKALPDGTLRAKLYPDGGGLYLQVTPQRADDKGKPRVAKSWIFRFTAAGGKERYMGLGPLDIVGLADAREKAAECRKLRHDGVDPIAEKRTRKATAALEQAKVMTFDQCAEAYINAHMASWKSPGHLKQWKNSLATYVTPVFGSVPVNAVDLALVTKVIEPLWSTKSETASRLRGRIEAILDWAATREFRKGDNPARWKGHLENLFPNVSKVHDVENFPALPYARMSDFMRDLRDQRLPHKWTLEFTILTAARSIEVLGATWSEIDLKSNTWTVPGARMKAGKEHRVPLGERAVSVLETMRARRENDYVFPGQRTQKATADVMLTVVRRMHYADVTVHGFRSTFKDWAAECTDFEDWVSEKALAHRVGDETRRAYQRGDLFEKRRKLMGAWENFCG
jgi:integrase